MQPTSTLAAASFTTKVRSLAVLFKLRLASLVVFSAALGYLFGIPSGGFSWVGFIGLCVAGTLLTGASNALNQVLEVREDDAIGSARHAVSNTLLLQKLG